MKRQFRDLRDDTKMRISQSLKGRSFSDSHKQAISDAMRQYWATIPYRPSDNNESNNLNDCRPTRNHFHSDREPQQVQVSNRECEAKERPT